MNSITKRHREMIVLYILPLVAVAVSLVTHANYFQSLFLFWGIPSALLTIWAYRRASKAAVFAVFLTVFLMSLDIIYYISKQWYVITTLNHRLLGFIAWEDVIYFFLFVYFPVIFWEHFHEKQRPERPWGKRMTLFVCISLFSSVAIWTTWLWAPHFLQMPYFYLLTCLLFVALPITFEIVFNPKLTLKFISTGLYFAYVAILYELTALQLGHWHYPSEQFLGWVEVVGLRFPVEELFAWILFGAAAILAVYEYFDDDNK